MIWIFISCKIHIWDEKYEIFLKTIPKLYCWVLKRLCLRPSWSDTSTFVQFQSFSFIRMNLFQLYVIKNLLLQNEFFNWQITHKTDFYISVVWHIYMQYFEDKMLEFQCWIKTPHISFTWNLIVTGIHFKHHIVESQDLNGDLKNLQVS